MSHHFERFYFFFKQQNRLKGTLSASFVHRWLNLSGQRGEINFRWPGWFTSVCRPQRRGSRGLDGRDRKPPPGTYTSVCVTRPAPMMEKMRIKRCASWDGRLTILLYGTRHAHTSINVVPLAERHVHTPSLSAYLWVCLKNKAAHISPHRDDNTYIHTWGLAGTQRRVPTHWRSQWSQTLNTYRTELQAKCV